MMNNAQAAGSSQERRLLPPSAMRPERNAVVRKRHDIQEEIRQRPIRCTDMAFQWDNSALQSKAFRIEMASTSDRFRDIGLVTEPVFVITDPPIAVTFGVRIRPDLYFNEDDEDDADDISLNSNPAETSMRDYRRQYITSQVGSYTKAQEVIGTGLFSSVMLIKDAEEKYYASKLIKFNGQKRKDRTLEEYNIMRRLRHPKLIGLHDFYYERYSCIFITKFLKGAALFKATLQNDFIREQDIPRILKQILEGLIYLHGLKIAHLDLKPDNIVFKYVNDYNLKIIDFSQAKCLNDNEEYVARIGTKDFVAPEVISRQGVRLTTDMWSVGVITYMLLSGRKPFDGDSWPKQSAKTMAAAYSYPDELFGCISQGAKDFIDALLKVSSGARMSASDALAHPWIWLRPPFLPLLERRKCPMYLTAHKKKTN